MNVCVIHFIRGFPRLVQPLPFGRHRQCAKVNMDAAARASHPVGNELTREVGQRESRARVRFLRTFRARSSAKSLGYRAIGWWKGRRRITRLRKPGLHPDSWVTGSLKRRRIRPLIRLGEPGSGIKLFNLLAFLFQVAPDPTGASRYAPAHRVRNHALSTIWIWPSPNRNDQPLDAPNLSTCCIHRAPLLLLRPSPPQS